MTADSRLKIKRSYLRAKFEAEYSVRIALPKFSLPDLSDLLINQVLPADVLSASSLTDIKGVDRSDSGRANEELLLLAGGVLSDGGAQPYEIQRYEKFNIARLSKFERFEGPHHIVHAASTNYHGSLDDSFKLTQIPRLFPIVLDRLRIGLELFTSQRTFIVGYSPEVTERLSIEATQNECNILISSEELKSKESLPLEAYQLMTNLDQALKQIVGWSIIEDYLRAAKGG